MNRKEWKPYFRAKGKYSDGRKRWIIEQKNEKGNINLLRREDKRED